MQIYRNQLAQNIVHKANFLSDAKSIISKGKKTKEKKVKLNHRKAGRESNLCLPSFRKAVVEMDPVSAAQPWFQPGSVHDTSRQ